MGIKPPASLVFILLMLLFGGCGGGGGSSTTSSSANQNTNQSPVNNATSVLSFRNIGPGGGSFLMSAAFDPVDPYTFYLGGDIEGPFKTTDSGSSFSRITSGIAQSDLSSGAYASQQIKIDPQNSSTLYIASWDGMLRSNDAGSSWNLIYPPNYVASGPVSLACLAISPFNSNIILAGVGDSWGNADGTGTIVRSIDGGTTFVDLGPATTGLNLTTVIHAIVFDEVSAGTVYAATGQGIIKSTDNGTTWALSNTGIPTASNVHGLVGVNNGGQFVLYASLETIDFTTFTSGGVYRSTDGGVSWQNISGNLPTNDPFDGTIYSYFRLAVDPVNPNVLYVGSTLDVSPAGLWWASRYGSAGVFKTSNALAATGVSWALTWTTAGLVTQGWLSPPFNKDRSVGFLAVSPHDSNIVIAGYDEALISLDAGSTWNPMDTYSVANNAWAGTGLELMGCMSATADPNNPDRWWIGYDDMGLWRTDDAGATFIRLDKFQDYEPSNPVDPQLNNTNGSDAVSDIVVDPVDSYTIYVARNGGSVDSSIDWAFGYAYKSSDAGATWSQLGPTQLTGGRIKLSMLAGGTTSTRTLLAAVFGKGLYRSTDSGLSWSVADTGIAAADKVHLWSLVSHPSNAQIAYAGVADATNIGGGTGAIYKSTNGGISWTKLANAPTAQILDLAIGIDSTVYAATTTTFSWLEPGTGLGSGGLYRSLDSGTSWSRVLSQPRIESVSVDPYDSQQVVAAAASYWNNVAGNSPGIYRSYDGGTTFTKESNGLSHTRFWFVNYSSDGQRIFAGTAGGGLFVTSGG